MNNLPVGKVALNEINGGASSQLKSHYLFLSVAKRQSYIGTLQDWIQHLPLEHLKLSQLQDEVSPLHVVLIEPNEQLIDPTVG